MATIAKLVIEMAADPQGVRAGLDRAEGYLRQFSKAADQALAVSKRGVAGSALADGIIGTLQDRLQASTDRIREQLFRGILSPEAARQHAQQAAQAMNATLLATLGELRARGLATAEIEHMLIGELSEVGLKAGQEFAGGVTAGAAKGALGLGRIRNGLVSLFASLSGTIPVLDRVGASVAAWGIGSDIVIAAVAGITAIAFVWSKLTEKTREATKAMNEFQQSDDALRKRAQENQIVTAALTAGGANPRLLQSLDTIGMTSQITALMKAVDGFKVALTPASGTNSLLSDTNQKIIALGHAFAQGKLPLTQFNAEMTALARTHPDFALEITRVTQLVAGLDAANEALRKLTASEQQRQATEKSNKARFGDMPGLTEDVANVDRRLAAFKSGGEKALHAAEDSISAMQRASAAWTDYITTAAGAKDATLSFRDALAQHNAAAEKAYGAALHIAQAERTLSEGVKQTDVEKLSQFTERLIRANEQIGKIGPKARDLQFAFVDALTSAHLMLSKQTDDLSETAIRLRTIIAELEGAFQKWGNLPPIAAQIPRTMSQIQVGGVFAPTPTAATLPHTALTGESMLVDGKVRQVKAGFTFPAPTASQLPPEQSLTQARLRVALDTLGDDALAVGGKLRDLAQSDAFSILRALGAQLNPLSQIISAIGQATKPLVPFFVKLASVVENTLGPIFQAFAPVLESLLPLLDALFRVFSPILRALAPLFQALVPILDALFPVVKEAAIVFTYVVQAAAFLAGIFFNIAGAFTTLVGGVIAAIGAVISKIPFLGGFGKSIQNAGNDVKNLGKGMEQTANDLFETSRQMGDARKEIEGINISDTQTALDSLGAAANLAAGALLNVPTGYKVALARFNATTPVNPQAKVPTGPPITTPRGTGGQTVGGGGGDNGGGSGGSGSDGGDTGGGNSGFTDQPSANVVFSIGAGAIVVQGGNKSASDLADELLDELKRRARANGYGNDWASAALTL